MRFFLGVLLLSLNACSSLLYHPSSQTFVDPKSVDLKPEEIWLPVKEGKIQVWYFHHAKKLIPAKALVLFFHGNGENLTSHYLTLKFLLDYGYDFAIFDYRGYGKSAFGEKGRTTPQSTVEDGIEFLRWGHATTEKTHLPWAVYAQSLGGAVAMRSLIETKTEFRPNLAIVDSTFASYQEEGQDVLKRGIISWPFQWLAYLVLSDEWAPGKRISEISPTPLWIFHGNEDQTVSYSLGREVFDLAKEPKEFWHIEGGHHVDALWGHHSQFRRKLVLKLDALFAPKSHSFFKEYGWSAERPNEVPIPDETYTYTLPYLPRASFEVLQGFDGHFSHQDENRYAIDFSMPEGTPVCAIRDGEVVQVKSDSSRGGPSSDYIRDANFILIRHEDGTIAEYYHLKRDGVAVKVGQKVRAGEPIGYSGQTGFSTEPHLHVEVYFIDSKGEKVSVPIVFDTVKELSTRLNEAARYQRP